MLHPASFLFATPHITLLRYTQHHSSSLQTSFLLATPHIFIPFSSFRIYQCVTKPVWCQCTKAFETDPLFSNPLSFFLTISLSIFFLSRLLPFFASHFPSYPITWFLSLFLFLPSFYLSSHPPFRPFFLLLPPFLPVLLFPPLPYSVLTSKVFEVLLD